MSHIVEPHPPHPPTATTKLLEEICHLPLGCCQSNTYLCQAHAITLEACLMHLHLFPVGEHPRGKGGARTCDPPP